MTPPDLSTDDTVSHPDFGTGIVEMADADKAVVRFGSDIKIVDPTDLTLKRDAEGALRRGERDPAADVLLRMQALAIRSLNEEWGVFSPSRIALLPHQLWVCRRVGARWPMRWLIADDVGLGKTIEAGLILAPLIANDRVRRVLILCPAKLVTQWVERLKRMFDLRFRAYAGDAAGSASGMNAWDAERFVVASAQTVRQGKHRDRLLEAEPWDLVIVDEAHHANANAQAAQSLLFSLLKEMEEQERFESLLLFTGTPHRGKDFGFLALLSLLRPDLFDPRRPAEEQLPHLREVMIRNNKANATDLKGERLFTAVTTENHSYSYTDEETTFYETLSAFIEDGRAYTDSMGGGHLQSARKLVLTTIQKLAASSVAAVRATLRNRIDALEGRVAAMPEAVDDDAEPMSAPAEVHLMRDEVARLRELLELADAVDEESKITRIITLVNDLPEGEAVLFFTEYKSTQALVVQALEEAFGEGCASFINGDDRLVLPEVQGGSTARESTRAEAADAFNAGRFRFLVSTEAAGEGIDLQHCCATLIHVDMPWNPMRMHQRVGRLSRYGQSRPVAVHVVRNPDTVDARIHDLLRHKLESIQSALDASMDEREDIAMLVIGMTPDGFYDELFAGAAEAGDRMTDWFDARTSRFDETSAVDTARAIFGSVDRFDFGRDSEDTPNLDLPDLERFLQDALKREHRRLVRNEDGTFSFKAPDSWRSDRRMRRSYDGLSLSRTQGENTLGVGHPAMDALLDDALARDAHVGVVDGLSQPLAIYTIRRGFDRAGERMPLIVIGMEGNVPLGPAALLTRFVGLKPSEGEATPLDASALPRNPTAAIEIAGKGDRVQLQGVLLPANDGGPSPQSRAETAGDCA